jgi:hypothetical protein
VDDDKTVLPQRLQEEKQQDEDTIRTRENSQTKSTIIKRPILPCRYRWLPDSRSGCASPDTLDVASQAAIRHRSIIIYNTSSTSRRRLDRVRTIIQRIAAFTEADMISNTIRIILHFARARLQWDSSCN